MVSSSFHGFWLVVMTFDWFFLVRNCSAVVFMEMLWLAPIFPCMVIKYIYTLSRGIFSWRREIAFCATLAQ
jgi:hypothetical protein